MKTESQKPAKALPIRFNIHIFSAQPKQWTLSMQVNSMPLDRHERCTRKYSSPGDAATSSRHLINELFKEGAK